MRPFAILLLAAALMAFSVVASPNYQSLNNPVQQNQEGGASRPFMHVTICGYEIGFCNFYQLVCVSLFFLAMVIFFTIRGITSQK